MTQHKAAIYKSESEMNERGKIKITLEMKIDTKLTPVVVVTSMIIILVATEL